MSSPFSPYVLWSNTIYSEDTRREGALIEFTNPNVIGDTSRPLTIGNGDVETVHVWKPNQPNWGWEYTGPVWQSDDPNKSRRDLMVGQLLYLQVPMGHAFFRPFFLSGR